MARRASAPCRSDRGAGDREMQEEGKLEDMRCWRGGAAATNTCATNVLLLQLRSGPGFIRLLAKLFPSNYLLAVCPAPLVSTPFIMCISPAGHSLRRGIRRWRGGSGGHDMVACGLCAKFLCMLVLHGTPNPSQTHQWTQRFGRFLPSGPAAASFPPLLLASFQ